MEVLRVNNRNHVIEEGSGNEARKAQGIPTPNYRGTGMALIGVLARKQSLRQWKDRYDMLLAERLDNER